MLRQGRRWAAVRQRHGAERAALAFAAQQRRQRLQREDVQQAAESAALLQAAAYWEGWGVVAMTAASGPA